MAGMRDRLIHGYFGVDYDIVWDVVLNKIPALQREVEPILRPKAPPANRRWPPLPHERGRLLATRRSKPSRTRVCRRGEQRALRSRYSPRLTPSDILPLP
jgi:Protein of unknown function DUF86